MFNSKQKQLFSGNKVKQTSAFVSAGLKNSAETVSGNGAKKYSTTSNPFVDQFGKIGSYKAPRSFNDISADCEILWAKNKLLTVMFIIYLRIINRVVRFWDNTSTTVPQKGGEMKHESIMRMIWLHMKSEESFWKNIQLFILAGSWKDIITMLQYDLVYNGWEDRKLNWTKFGDLILSGLKNDSTSELLKKYLPQIKSNNQCKTIESQADNLIGKWICSLLFDNKKEDSGWTYKKYRQLKTSGTAHQWQQLISQRKFEEIDFSKIHGRALNLLVRSKFLFNQNLIEKYAEWAVKPETVLKYTGFVHELFDKLPRTLVGLNQGEQATINKQFETLVKKGGEQSQTSLIVVRDTSGSMGSSATGTTMSCFNVAKALALYFSEFLTGTFKDAFIEFNSTAQMHTWKGNTPLEKWYNDSCNFVGSTNFQSVINLICRLRFEGIEESEFPTGILCISDSEFNPAQLGKTNVDTALIKLRKAGFSEDYVDNFVIVLWNLQSNAYGRGTGEKFETFGNVPNVFYFSGYSASVVSFLTNKINNAEELFNSAMNQELLNQVEI
jgi:hypothetical protein